MEKSSLCFHGDVKNDEEIHRFIVDALPQVSPAHHEQLTAFAQGKDVALSPELDLLCEQPHVQEVIDALVVASLQEIRKTMQRLETEFRDVDCQVDAFTRCIAPYLSIEERILVTRYIHSKALKIPIPVSEEKDVYSLCAQRPDIRDIIHYFAGTMDADTFMKRYGERLWQHEWEDLEDEE